MLNSTDIRFYSDAGSTLKGSINCGASGLYLYGLATILHPSGYILLDPSGGTVYTNANIIPSSNNTYNVGSGSYAAATMFAYDFNDVGDYFLMDTEDDLAILHAIKGSGLVDEITGLELIDDSSLSELILSRYKKNGEPIYKKDARYKNGGRKIGESKKGDIIRNLDGKPFLSHKMWASLFRGSICQMDNKYAAEISSLRQEIEKLKISMSLN